MDRLAEQFVDFLFGLSGFTVYLLVGVFAWAEAAFFLGFVTPGELALATGGVLAAYERVSLAVVVIAAAMGTVLGNTTGYWIGRRWGARLLEWPPLQRIVGGAISTSQDFMERRGAWAIVLSRASSFTRIVTPFLAGASRFSYRRFLLFDIPAGAVWAAVWVVVGYFLGESWTVLLDRSGEAAFLVLGLFVLALLIRAVAVRVARNRERIQRAVRRAIVRAGMTGVVRTLAPAGSWLTRRLNPRLRAGLGLTLGFLVLVLGAAGTGLVLLQTRAVEGLALLDFPVLDWMSATRTDEAIEISRSFLVVFDWPGVFVFVVPLLLLLLLWRGGPVALRVGVGIVGVAVGAFVLDRFVLEGIVPRAEFPSVPVAVASALWIHATVVAGEAGGWGRGVTTSAVTFFLLCSVALATIVAGWAAPSGIALALAMGIMWASWLEVQAMLLRMGDR
ncbi:MAG: DedA family protein [Gemmatimonadota bacterium]